MSKLTGHAPVQLTVQDQHRLRELREQLGAVAKERAFAIGEILNWPRPPKGSRVVILSWPVGTPTLLTAEQQGAWDNCVANGGSPIVSMVYDENDNLVGTHGGCDGPTMCQTLW